MFIDATNYSFHYATGHAELTSAFEILNIYLQL